MRERGTGKFELSHNLNQDNETKQTHLFLILSLFSLFPRRAVRLASVSHAVWIVIVNVTWRVSDSKRATGREGKHSPIGARLEHWPEFDLQRPLTRKIFGIRRQRKKKQQQFPASFFAFSYLTKELSNLERKSGTEVGGARSLKGGISVLQGFFLNNDCNTGKSIYLFAGIK